MDYRIIPSEDRKYIILKIIGNISRESAMRCNVEAHGMGKRLGINRFLTDLTESRNVESTFENYKFAYQDMKQNAEIDRHARVAVLVDPEDHSHDFIETVARNSGLNVTLFRDRKQAMDHLTSD